MTDDELLAGQKRDFLRLTKVLDQFQHSFAGSDRYWDIPYPIRGRKNRWGRCHARRYKGRTSFSFANRLYASFDPSEGKFEFDMNDVWQGRNLALSSAADVIAWLEDVREDPFKANARMVAAFPKEERMGLLPRSVVEHYCPDFISIRQGLGKGRSARFAKLVESGYFWKEENAHVENMTANKFFEYCRIGYLAAEEKDDHLDRRLSGREMYKRYSDGRYGALLDIDPDSTDEFMKWLDGKISCERRGSDHPWEIKRGGNTTHIDLYVRRVRRNWYASEEAKAKEDKLNKVVVGLDGHHIGRIVETVKMFLAINKAGLPIWIDDAECVRDRILALDFVGILPESDSLHRGWQEFPPDLHVTDVMHASEFGRLRRSALSFATWKPLPLILPVKRSIQEAVSKLRTAPVPRSRKSNL